MNWPVGSAIRMDTISWSQSAVLLFILGSIICAPITSEDELEEIKLNFRDMTEALDFLHAAFPADMPLEARCKRYAVMTSFLSSKGRPQSMLMSLFFNLTHTGLDEFYSRLDAFDQLPSLFMTAIDGYRTASHIGPPFIELLDCLKLIDRPFIRTYLENPELIMIQDLYQRIVRAPDFKIDLRPLEQSQFSPAFLTSLRSIFKDKILGYKENDFDRRKKRTGHPWSSRDPRSMATTLRHREQERLRKYRLKLLRPVKREVAGDRSRTIRAQNRKLRDERHLELLRMTNEWYKSFLDRSKHQEENAKSDESETTPWSTDLNRLWADAAPIYDSIPTPRISDKPGANLQLSPVPERLFNPETASQSENQDQLPPPPKRRQLERPVRSEMLSPIEPLLNQSGPQAEPGIPCSPPVYHSGASTSTASSDRYVGHHSPEYNYMTDSESQGRFDLPALHRMDQFEDIESVLRSFSDMPQAQAADSNEGKSEGSKDGSHRLNSGRRN